MCKKRIGQLLGLSLLALVLTACGQKGDLFLPESEEAEKAATDKETPDERDPKDGPIMDTEQPSTEEGAEPQGDQP